MTHRCTQHRSSPSCTDSRRKMFDFSSQSSCLGPSTRRRATRASIRGLQLSTQLQRPLDGAEFTVFLNWLGGGYWWRSGPFPRCVVALLHTNHTARLPINARPLLLPSLVVNGVHRQRKGAGGFEKRSNTAAPGTATDRARCRCIEGSLHGGGGEGERYDWKVRQRV